MFTRHRTSHHVCTTDPCISLHHLTSPHFTSPQLTDPPDIRLHQFSWLRPIPPPNHILLSQYLSAAPHLQLLHLRHAPHPNPHNITSHHFISSNLTSPHTIPPPHGFSQDITTLHRPSHNPVCRVQAETKIRYIHMYMNIYMYIYI